MGLAERDNLCFLSFLSLGSAGPSVPDLVTDQVIIAQGIAGVLRDLPKTQGGDRSWWIWATKQRDRTLDRADIS
jgi:hypothetical protein